MAHAFHHVHIKTDEPRELAKWFSEVFDAKILPERESPYGLHTPVELSGVLINISCPHPEDKMGKADSEGHYGLEHIGILTDDLDRDLARLREQGLTIYELRESVFARSGRGRIAFVEAKGGVRVELIYRPDEYKG